MRRLECFGTTICLGVLTVLHLKEANRSRGLMSSLDLTTLRNAVAGEPAAARTNRLEEALLTRRVA